MNRTWMVACALAAGTVFAAGDASAQQWLTDRRLQEGRGIRAGNFELHPSIGVEFGYDSNVFYTPPDLSATPALRLRVVPSFSVSTLGEQRRQNSDSQPTALPTVNFRGGVGLVYHEWIPITTPDTVSRLRNLGGNANIRIELFPQRTWQFVLVDEFTRTIQPGSTFADAATGVTGATFNRNYNHAAAELVFAPGSGVFDLRFGYAFNVSFFDDAPFTRNDYLQHEITTRMRWRFLPKTALLWEGFVRPTSYIDPDRFASGRNGLFSSTPVGTRVGLNGLLTEKFAILAMVGYQATFFEAGDNFDTVIGQAEVRWIINSRSSARLGFLRDIQNSFFGNYYLQDRGYLNYSQTFGGRFLLAVDGALALLDFGYVANRSGARDPTLTQNADPATGRFSSVRVEGSLFGEYRLSDVFGINATLRALANISDARLATDVAAAQYQSIAWTRFEAFLGARANW